MLGLSELSLVFQGPIIGGGEVLGGKQVTRKCVAQTRAALPGAEIILSTWEGSDTTGIEADRIILNTDPGVWHRDDGVACNVNRQIVSTYAGLLAVRRPYAVKIRTDTALTGPEFIRQQGLSRPRDPALGIFNERILILDKYTRNPSRLPLLHHPSDIFQFGQTADLRRLWSVALADPRDMVGWSKHPSRPRLRAFDNPQIYFRYADEQYVWITCLQKFTKTRPLDYLWQCRLADIGRAEASLANNFVVVSEQAAQVQLPEKFAHHGWIDTCYTSAEWDKLMRIYARGWRQLTIPFRVLAIYLASRLVLLRNTWRVF